MVGCQRVCIPGPLSREGTTVMTDSPLTFSAEKNSPARPPLGDVFAACLYYCLTARRTYVGGVVLFSLLFFFNAFPLLQSLLFAPASSSCWELVLRSRSLRVHLRLLDAQPVFGH